MSKKKNSAKDRSKNINTISVGRGKNRRELPIKLVPVVLSKEENDARVEKLTFHILRVMESVRKRSPESEDEISKIFDSDLEKELGI